MYIQLSVSLNIVYTSSAITLAKTSDIQDLLFSWEKKSCTFSFIQMLKCVVAEERKDCSSLCWNRVIALRPQAFVYTEARALCLDSVSGDSLLRWNQKPALQPQEKTKLAAIMCPWMWLSRNFHCFYLFSLASSQGFKRKLPIISVKKHISIHASPTCILSTE